MSGATQEMQIGEIHLGCNHLENPIGQHEQRQTIQKFTFTECDFTGFEQTGSTWNHSTVAEVTRGAGKVGF